MASVYARRAVAEPVSRVELRISCQNLKNKDTTSKSDPCCVLSMLDKSGVYFEVGRTENVKNCLDPQFVHAFEIDYYFEEVQKLQLSVYDIDNKTPTLNDDDFLGQLDCTLGEVVSNCPLTKPLLIKGKPVKGKKSAGSTITVTATEISRTQEILIMTFRAEKLDKKDVMGKSDPYLEFCRALPDGTWQVVQKTEVVTKNLSPRWRPVEIKASRLGDMPDSPVKINCYDYDSDGSSDLIGSFTTSVAEMMQAASNKELSWPCINSKKAGKKGYKNSGTVFLMSCIITKDYSFLDFILAGLQVNFTVAIDFTGSNGDPRDSQSLHCIHPNHPNQYIQAIQTVGTVIQDYDSDQCFPALGFGAKVPPNMEVSHEFAINFNATNPFCIGINGILEAYRTCLSQVVLYGPTNFSPVIYHVAKFAAAAQQEQGAKNYYVLLILTDGEITDVANTIRAIVYASSLPLSIIIVGVGEADFDKMDVLDSDDGLLADSAGNRAKRDIVQFVPIRNFRNAPLEMLSKHVLAEVPRQVCDYYRMYGITPGTGIRMNQLVQLGVSSG